MSHCRSRFVQPVAASTVPTVYITPGLRPTDPVPTLRPVSILLSQLRPCSNSGIVNKELCVGFLVDEVDLRHFHLRIDLFPSCHHSATVPYGGRSSSITPPAPRRYKRYFSLQAFLTKFPYAFLIVATRATCRSIKIKMYDDITSHSFVTTNDMEAGKMTE